MGYELWILTNFSNQMIVVGYDFFLERTTIEIIKKDLWMK